MAEDMEVDVFAEYKYGKIALQKLAPVPENFRLYEAGWMGDKPQDWNIMKVTGAKFRRVKTGQKKGSLCIMIPGTKRTAYVTREEMD